MYFKTHFLLSFRDTCRISSTGIYINISKCRFLCIKRLLNGTSNILHYKCVCYRYSYRFKKMFMERVKDLPDYEAILERKRAVRPMPKYSDNREDAMDVGMEKCYSFLTCLVFNNSIENRFTFSDAVYFKLFIHTTKFDTTLCRVR